MKLISPLCATRCRQSSWALPMMAALLGGCAPQSHYVVASSGTVIGVEIGQHPATQTPQFKLGYDRAELAVVPTNRNSSEQPGDYAGGATGTTDVLMELKYKGIFASGADCGIYQRLAVGSVAVQRPGAAVMFAKGNDCKVSAESANAVESVAAQADQ